MKLNEVIQPASQFMTDHDQIEAWLFGKKIKNYSIHPNGVVDVDGNVMLRRRGLSSIPVQFGKVTGQFICSSNLLTSFAGCPYWVGDMFGCAINKITSLSGIHNVFKHIGNGFVCDRHVTNILGLMLIDGLESVNIVNAGPVNEIMNRYLRGSRDIHKCQEELIEAGFGAQAKL